MGYPPFRPGEEYPYHPDLGQGTPPPISRMGYPPSGPGMPRSRWGDPIPGPDGGVPHPTDGEPVLGLDGGRGYLILLMS